MRVIYKHALMVESSRKIAGLSDSMNRPMDLADVVLVHVHDGVQVLDIQMQGKEPNVTPTLWTIEDTRQPRVQIGIMCLPTGAAVRPEGFKSITHIKTILQWNGSKVMHFFKVTA